MSEQNKSVTRVFATDGSIRKWGAYWAFVEVELWQSLDSQGDESPGNLILSCGKCDPPHTSNRGELTAILRALQSCKGAAHIYTDSMYCIDSISEWMYRWDRNGWRTRDKQPVKNRDIFEQLLTVTHLIPVEFTHVKGHSGVDVNELADTLAELAADNQLTLNANRTSLTHRGQAKLEASIHLRKPKKRINFSTEAIVSWMRSRY